MINMNEVAIAEELISERGVVSPSPYKEINLLARYYNDEGYTEEETQELILNLLKSKIDDFLEIEWIEKIERTVKTVFKKGYTLKKIDKIYVTEEEVEFLRTIEEKRERKLLFTLMCLARFRNLLIGRIENRQYHKSSEITKLSNIGGTVKRELNRVYYSLKVKGYIEFFGKGEEENKIKINTLIESNNIAFEITKLESLGNLIEDELNIRYNDYKRCGVCGKAYKPKAKDYSSKYCNICKKEIQKEKQRESMKKLRGK